MKVGFFLVQESKGTDRTRLPIFHQRTKTNIGGQGILRKATVIPSDLPQGQSHQPLLLGLAWLRFEVGKDQQTGTGHFPKYLVLVFVKQTTHPQHHVWFIFHRHFQKQSCVGQKDRFHPAELFQGNWKVKPFPSRFGGHQSNQKRKRVLDARSFAVFYLMQPKQNTVKEKWQRDKGSCVQSPL